MKKLLFIILIFSATAAVSFAQIKFVKKNASRNYDAQLEVERCWEETCDGKLKVELFKKSSPRPFQIINLETTEFALEEVKLTNSKRRYDYQSIIFFEDYNFDGIEDLAIKDGNNSAYSGPSYQIYLFSPRRGKFVYSAAMTDLGQSEYLGMFEVDKKKRVLRAFSKGGCCMHTTTEFRVINNRPVKVFENYEVVEWDEKTGNRVRIETSRLIKGRWQTRTSYKKVKD